MVDQLQEQEIKVLNCCLKSAESYVATECAFSKKSDYDIAAGGMVVS